MLQHQAETREKRLTAAYLPRTNNLAGKVKQSLAHLRDVENIIKEMTLIFYPKQSSGDPWYKGIQAALEIAHATNPDIVEFFDKLRNSLLAVADHRNAMIHPDNTKWVAITDYELQANGSIVAPTIEITHARNPVPRQDIVQFLQSQVEIISYVYETFLAWLCDLNSRMFVDMFETHVVTLPEGEVRNGSRVIWQTMIKEGYEMVDGKIQPKG